MIKWYENQAVELGIPLFSHRYPASGRRDGDEDRIRYIRAQFDDCVRKLEDLTGKKWDEDRFREVMANSQRSSKAWLKPWTT